MSTNDAVSLPNCRNEVLMTRLYLWFCFMSESRDPQSPSGAFNLGGRKARFRTLCVSSTLDAFVVAPHLQFRDTHQVHHLISPARCFSDFQHLLTELLTEADALEKRVSSGGETTRFRPGTDSVALLACAEHQAGLLASSTFESATYVLAHCSVDR